MADLDFKPCALVPIYNHGSTVRQVVAGLAARHLPVVVVDDGSDAATKAVLAGLPAEFLGCHVHTLPVNLGKGGAVSEGFRQARNLGFSHAVQVDADGQHDIATLDILMAQARKDPGVLVCGRPVYDSSMPLGRRIGRNITSFFVTLECLSGEIKDAMCGFRIYPVGPSAALVDRVRLDPRMGFDIEILVRLYWQGLRLRFFPVRVIYPEDGISHFRMFRDNLAISWVHTRLCLGMLWRSPWLLVRNLWRILGTLAPSQRSRKA